MAERRRPGFRNANKALTTRARSKRSAKNVRAKTKKPAAKTKSKKSAVDPYAAVRRYRERMRAKGLRPMTIWVPDVSAPEFVHRLQRDIRRAAEFERTNPQAREDAELWDKFIEESWADLPDYDWGADGPPKG